MSFQEEWQQKKEERQRKRMEQEKSLTKSEKSSLGGEKTMTEAERKAQELRDKREQDRVEAEQRTHREILQNSTVSALTPERKEEIRRAREERERAREERERLEKAEEEERKARAEEEMRKMREDIQRRRQEAEAKRRQATEQDPKAYSIPKYNIAESIAKAKKEKSQTSAEMMVERERRVEQNVPQIRISARDSEERLREIAEMLHAKLVEVYGDIYDLKQRKERQQYDLSEMNARIKDLTKQKTVIVTTVDRGHVSMLKERALTVEEKTKPKQQLDTKASLPSTGSISDRLQQLQNNLKKDQEIADKNIKKEPIMRTFSTAEQVKEEVEASKREVERFRQQREENRKKREEERRRMEQYEEERRKREEEERRRQEEERARLKREKEEREKARQAATSVNSFASPVSIGKVVSKQKAKNREDTIAERVPPLKISSSTSDAELREIANDLYNRLKTTYGDIFDLEEKKNRNEYDKTELTERVGYLKANKSSPIVSTGIVSKMKDGGAWTAKKQNGVGKSPKPKELGSISSEGGVKGRMAMFSAGQSPAEKPKSPAPAKVNIYK
ncbi:uncharacterized protein [Diadema antillarum]|uniref:uncharacterized protein n=1 Tax=Diadema antillarum TaxID=105358 RepID=UPI003A88554B